MIEEKDDSGRVPDPGIPARDLIKSLNRQRAGDIVDHGAVYVRHDKLASMYLFLRGFGKYLLRQGLATHGKGHLIHDK